MNLLFLSRWFPFPPDNGSKIRIWNSLRSLGQQHQVRLLTFTEDGPMRAPAAVEALREHCSSVGAVQYRRFRPHSATAITGLVSNRPRWLVDTFSNEMKAAVMDEVARHPPDLIIASQLDMAPYVLDVSGIPALLEELEVTSLAEQRRDESLFKRCRSAMMWLKLSAYLRRVLPRFAACTVASDRELVYVHAAAPEYAHLVVIPNSVDVNGYAGDWGAPSPNSLVFSGALTYAANYDGAKFFLGQVFPEIVRAVPKVILKITGDTTGVDLAPIPRPAGVEYTGYVGDIRPVVAQSWGSVVPLRYGGGTRVKILEAMALGTPVVTTSKGAEGLDARHDEHLLIADKPESFAEQVVQLLVSPDLRARLAKSGRQLVRAKYDVRAVGQELCDLVEKIVVSPRGLGR